MPSTRARLACLALAAATATASAAFADTAYLDRFEGSWKGSGKVLRDVDPSPRSVSCSMASKRPDANHITLSGTCRALVVFTREIGADIRYDPASKRYSGTYTGAKSGPAALSGKQDGNAIVFAVRYGKPIFGDTDAVMTITNTGKGSFSLVVTDQVDGKTIQTSNVSFKKS
ncbi:hypothetical protein NPA31_005540 [Aurantimonas sp. MSK8Z-1]|uniref:hypothetical protein n=1 Tax=Mangrovibrevibacter kandeliae TaxID=2968473 RepID=UPI0021180C79|nr:hypothetical protein [Aurantimonas sp. MSK8Z-1]MCW4114425.1 hypothetical protein [Aurantimonas sp. MSK8Z-1]